MIIEEDIKSQLLRLGIHEGAAVPTNQLEHLDGPLLEKRRRIEKAIDREKMSGVSGEDAFRRYVRHVGSTFLNRVAALRAMEVRELIRKETVMRKDEYAGYSAREYEIVEKQRMGNPEMVAEIAFREACAEISEEIDVLFDLGDEYSFIFPSARALNEIYDIFGKRIPEEDWQSDDVIGWILVAAM